FMRVASSAATLEILFSFESRLSGDPDRETNAPFGSDSRSESDQKSASEIVDGRVSRARAAGAGARATASKRSVAARNARAMLCVRRNGPRLRRIKGRHPRQRLVESRRTHLPHRLLPV